MPTTEPPAHLLPQHWDQLTQDSGLSAEIISERGYRSILPPGGYADLKPYGFTRAQARLPGLLLPLWTTDGEQARMIYRPDQPRQDKDGKPKKYENPKDFGVRVDCPPRCRHLLGDPTVRLWVTEGIKKGDALALRDLCAIALLGVYGFKGKNPFGGVTFLADFDYITLKGRQVIIVFDSDVMTKPAVKQALLRFIEHLHRKGAQVCTVYLPQEGGAKVGVDDYLLIHTVQDLEGLIEQPRPQIQPAAPMIRLLDCFPDVMGRPLQMVSGHGYAATWLPVEVTATEQKNKAGEVVRLTEPRVTIERRLFVVADDGAIFSETPDPKMKALSDLGFSVNLANQSPDSVAWSPRGVVSYRKGIRTEPKAIFRRIVSLYDHFLDFHGALSGQLEMCELSGCLTFMTWVADAFTVLPYPWSTSPGPGSGKTKWGICWAKTSYLGYQTTMGGTFSALRDLAEAGATLFFDDAEVLSELDLLDPDKRELVLAGNRKGVQIPLKEPIPGGGWRLRWMNAYCPRGFSAIRLPGGALETRCIVILLLKTADAARANRDPADEACWPVDRRQLIDDLWGASVSLLPAAAKAWSAVASEQAVVGRAFEPWRAVLAVARMIEDCGYEGLYHRMRGLMLTYQTHKQGFIAADPISLLLRAAYAIVKHDVPDVDDVLTFLCQTPHHIKFKTADLTKKLFSLAKESDTSPDLGDSPGRKIGHLLSKLRFMKDDTESSRGWKIMGHELARLMTAHGIIQWQQTEGDPSQKNVRTSGTSGTSEDGMGPFQHPEVAHSRTSGSSGLSGTSGTDQPTCPTCGQSNWLAVPGGDAVCKHCARKGAA